MSRADGKAWPWLRVLVGTVALVAGLGASVAAAVAIREAVAFGAARPCAGDAARDCVRGATAVVLDRDEYSSRGETSYDVTIRLDGATREVTFPEPENVYDGLTLGTEAGVRLWRGRVVEIGTAQGGFAPTEAHPRLDAVTWTVFALVTLTSGAYALASGIATGRRRGLRHAAEPARSPRLAALLVVAVGAWAVFAAITWLDVYEVPALAGFALAGCVAALVVKRRDLRR